MVRTEYIAIAAVFLVLAGAFASTGMNINVEVVVPIGIYMNTSVNLSANHTTLIYAPEVNTTLELAFSQNATGSINIILTSTPIDIPSLSVPSLNKYLKIEASESITNNLNYIIIKLYYTDEEVIASGLKEGTMGFYRWNQTSSSWEKLTSTMDWVYGTGVDTMGNYVWANVSHFSDYSIGGVRVAPSIELARELPSQVRINKKFEMELKLKNLADFDILDLTIMEKIPKGYDLKKEKKIDPKPDNIKYENGETIIYWRIKKLPAHKQLSLEYTISAPNRAGNYSFRADAFGFDAFRKKYSSFNVAKQDVFKPPLWKRLWSFFEDD